MEMAYNRTFIIFHKQCHEKIAGPVERCKGDDGLSSQPDKSQQTKVRTILAFPDGPLTSSFPGSTYGPIGKAPLQFSRVIGSPPDCSVC